MVVFRYAEVVLISCRSEGRNRREAVQVKLRETFCYNELSSTHTFHSTLDSFLSLSAHLFLGSCKHSEVDLRIETVLLGIDGKV